MTAETLYPVAEVAQLWRCSRVHVYDLINRGRIRTVNVGNGKAKTRIPESALQEFVQGTEPPAGPATPPNPTKPKARRRTSPPPPPPPNPIGPEVPQPGPHGPQRPQSLTEPIPGGPTPMPVPTEPPPRREREAFGLVPIFGRAA